MGGSHMDKMAALMEKNLQLLLENVEELTGEELEEEALCKGPLRRGWRTLRRGFRSGCRRILGRYCCFRLSRSFRRRASTRSTW